MKYPIRRLVTGLAVVGCSTIAGAQTVIGLNFQASSQNDTGSLPPDTMGAVGLNHYVEFINGKFTIFDKRTGAMVGSSMSDNAFWGTTIDSQANVSDPRIIFDPVSKRWFASQIDFMTDDNTGEVLPDNNFLLAVSTTSDPTGSWTKFSMRGDPTGQTLTDFPRLGVNADAVTLAGTNFTLPDENADHETVISIPKADLLQATPTIARKTHFTSLNLSTVGFTLQPVTDFGPSSGKTGLLAIDNDQFSKLDRTNVLGATAAGATVSSTVGIFTNPTRTPPTAIQPDTTARIDTNDDRISAGVYKVGNSLWATQCIGTPDFPNRNPRAGIRWYQINDSTNAIIQQATIGDVNHDYFFPSIAANQFGDVVIGFTRSSSTEYASAYAMVGSTDGGGVTTFGAPILLKDGVGAYDVSLFGAENRWGDYSATTIDPADPYVFWTAQEWADEPDPLFGSGVWATQATELIIQKPGDFRWSDAVSGTFATAGNWLPGSAPGSTGHAIFSKASTSSYTVTLGGSTTNKRMSVRQGIVALALSGNTYTLSETDATKPSLAVGEFGGLPQLTVSGGTLQSVNALVGAGTATATMILTGAGTTWNNSGSIFVGGASSAASGNGTLRIQSSAALNVGGTLKAWAGGRIEYNGGTLTTGGINLAGGGKLVVSAGGTKLIRTGTIAIDTGAVSQLDLSDNGLIVTAMPVGTWNGSAYSGVTGLVASGLNGGTWDGGGIMTSQSSARSPNVLTALVTATAKDALGIGASQTTTWLGRSVAGTDVLVMYTYGGDANLDGILNGDDYFQIDSHFNQAGLVFGYFNGDFNYDGDLNGDDYFVIDSNWNVGSHTPLFTPSMSVGVTAVPEPAALSIAFGSMLLLRRRRERV